MFLAKEVFETVIKSTPLVSIDLVVNNAEGQVLLGLRNNRPAQGFWFVPGGRILKDESMADAFARLCRQELGINRAITEANFVGPYQHFYNDCVFNVNISTHYVVLAYEIVVDVNELVLPKEQHNEYRWFDVAELLNLPEVHEHSKWYFQ